MSIFCSFVFGFFWVIVLVDFFNKLFLGWLHWLLFGFGWLKNFQIYTWLCDLKNFVFPSFILDNFSLFVVLFAYLLNLILRFLFFLMVLYAQIDGENEL